MRPRKQKKFDWFLFFREMKWFFKNFPLIFFSTKYIWEPLVWSSLSRNKSPTSFRPFPHISSVPYRIDMLAVLKLPATTPGGVLTVDASLSLHATPYGRRHQRQRPVWTQGRPFLRQRRFSAFHGLRPHRLHHGVYAGGTRQPAVDCSPSETENAPLKSSSSVSVIIT